VLLRIRRTRLEHGLALQDAASQVGVAPGALSRIECGRELPWPAIRTRLANLYGIAADELFSDIDAAQKHLRQIAGQGAP